MLGGNATPGLSADQMSSAQCRDSSLFTTSSGQYYQLAIHKADLYQDSANEGFTKRSAISSRSPVTPEYRVRSVCSTGQKCRRRTRTADCWAPGDEQGRFIRSLCVDKWRGRVDGSIARPIQSVVGDMKRSTRLVAPVARTEADSTRVQNPSGNTNYERTSWLEAPVPILPGGVRLAGWQGPLTCSF